MNDIGRELLLKLLAQVDRGGKSTLPVTPRFAKAYFADGSLDVREAIHASLRNAERAGAVVLKWGKGAAAQDLEQIRLCDAEALALWLGVDRVQDHAERMRTALQPLLSEAPDWLRSAYAEAARNWQKGLVGLRIPHDQPQEAQNLFRVALAVARNKQAGLDLRRFSVRVLGDSKGIESRRGLLAHLLRRNPTWSELDDDGELFRALGLEKFVQPLLFKGPLKLLYNGAAWDVSPLTPYVGLSPDLVRELSFTRPPAYLLTIENLASFHRHVREIEDDGLVVYTAGFPSPSLQSFLGMLNVVLPPSCPVFHWGDRDLGGLRIFAKLAEAYPGRELLPHLMNSEQGPGQSFTQQEREQLSKISAKPTVAGRLAERWLVEGLGHLEQEAVDPRRPISG